MREDHLAPRVSHNTQLSASLQTQLNDLSESDLNDVEDCWAACVGPSPASKCSPGRECDPSVRSLYADASNIGGCKSNQISLTVYEETSDTNLWDFWSSGRATKRSYESGLLGYDFARNGAKNGDTASV